MASTLRFTSADLDQFPDDLAYEAVTFLSAGSVDSRARGIDEKEAAELRARLQAFAEDWESP